jgi:hypothetical protein
MKVSLSASLILANHDETPRRERAIYRVYSHRVIAVQTIVVDARLSVIGDAIRRSLDCATGAGAVHGIGSSDSRGALAPAMFSTHSFLSRVFRFPSLYLCLKFLVVFCQRVAGGCHRFKIVSQLPVLFLKLRYLGFQLLVLLLSFYVLAGSQGQTQCDCHGKHRPNVFARHTSSFADKNLKSNLDQPICGWAGNTAKD